MIHTINQKSQSIGICINKKNFVVGFDNIKIARRVQYCMHPEPKLSLVRGEDIDMSDKFTENGINGVSLTLDVKSTLFIPKYKGSPADPMNDGGFHIQNHKQIEFMAYPLTKMIGIIIPYHLLDEDENEFMFRAHLIEPFFDKRFFKT